MDVSIHTPTKGVTCYQYLYQTPGRSFNPHTHEGCDYTLAVCIVAFQGFNPHTHEGCDGIYCPARKQYVVSIHTPTKGVTMASSVFTWLCRFQSTHPRRVWLKASIVRPLSKEFQSTHPRRVWHVPTVSSVLVPVFQSTHPRRVWRTQGQSCWTGSSFNPHTHEGCDRPKMV